MNITTQEALLSFEGIPPTPNGVYYLFIDDLGRIGVATGIWFDSRAFSPDEDVFEIMAFACERIAA